LQIANPFFVLANCVLFLHSFFQKLNSAGAKHPD